MHDLTQVRQFTGQQDGLVSRQGMYRQHFGRVRVEPDGGRTGGEYRAGFTVMAGERSDERLPSRGTPFSTFSGESFGVVKNKQWTALLEQARGTRMKSFKHLHHRNFVS